MRGVSRLVKDRVQKSWERDRSLERYVEAASRLAWPWREPWLLPLVGTVAVLDYVSTYAALELSGKGYVYESGALAGWALRMGGFDALLMADIAAVVALLLGATATRFFCLKLGFNGFGRAVFVVLLVPYVVVAVAAAVNNTILTFL